MNPWFAIASAAVPEVIAIVKAIQGLKRKYPALTADQINAAVLSITAQADTAFDDVLGKIAADQAAHPHV
jgi:hypothetical protein